MSHWVENVLQLGIKCMLDPQWLEAIKGTTLGFMPQTPFEYMVEIQISWCGSADFKNYQELCGKVCMRWQSWVTIKRSQHSKTNSFVLSSSIECIQSNRWIWCAIQRKWIEAKSGSNIWQLQPVHSEWICKAESAEQVHSKVSGIWHGNHSSDKESKYNQWEGNWSSMGDSRDCAECSGDTKRVDGRVHDQP